METAPKVAEATVVRIVPCATKIECRRAVQEGKGPCLVCRLMPSVDAAFNGMTNVDRRTAAERVIEAMDRVLTEVA